MCRSSQTYNFKASVVPPFQTPATVNPFSSAARVALACVAMARRHRRAPWFCQSSPQLPSATWRSAARARMKSLEKKTTSQRCLSQKGWIQRMHIWHYIYIYIYITIHIYIYIYTHTYIIICPAVIRTMDREWLRKVPDPYPFLRAHHSIQTVLILLLSPTCYYFSSCYCCC